MYRKTIHDSSWKEIQTPIVGCWQFYVHPTQEEFQEIAASTGFPIEAVQTTFDPYDLPRLEKEGSSVLLAFRVPVKLVQRRVNGRRFLSRFSNLDVEWDYATSEQTDNGHITRTTTEPMVFIITETEIISIVRQVRPFTDRLLSDPDLVSTQKTKFLLRVLLHCIARYRTALTDINRQILNTRGTIRILGDEDVLSLVEIEETLTNFNSALVPLIGIFEKISLGKVVPLFERDKDILEELIVSGREIVDWCKLNIKSAVNIREAHSTILTNSLNRTIKFLSSMTIIITIPNIIAGLFGMNVALPFQEHAQAFLFVLGLIVLFVAVLVGIFLKKRWL